MTPETPLGNIYIISNTINDKVYIGQTWQTLHDRFKKPNAYRGCHKIHRAFQKHGKHNFSIHLIATSTDQRTLDFLERFWIKTYDSVNNGYNISEGGAHGIFTPEVREKMSKSHKGKRLSSEHVAKMSAARRGKTFSEQAKRNMSAAQKGRKKRPLTDEERENLRRINTGKKMSAEEIERSASKRRGKKRTEEQKQRMRDGIARRKELTNASANN